MKLFITGATGFLGYHITKACVRAGYDMLCLKRKTSVSKFPQEIEDQLKWVIKDENGWKETIKGFRPDIFLHGAWEGVSATVRNDERLQARNFQLFVELMNLYPYRQIIGLGSQEEYGRLNSIVNEAQPLKPETAYAKNKISCCEQLMSFSGKTNCEWQWIRVFTIYGEQQNASWIIPSTIRSCLKREKNIAATLGEQQYAYLYCDDFAKAIVSVIGAKGKSGIYNLSSSHVISLRHLFFTIKELIHADITIDFGAYPYRSNQSMLICGQSDKFAEAFGKFEKTSLEEGLHKTIISIKNETI